MLNAIDERLQEIFHQFPLNEHMLMILCSCSMFNVNSTKIIDKYVCECEAYVCSHFLCVWDS